MEWRSWLRNKLIADATLTALVPASRIFASGSLEGRIILKPFIVVRVDDDVPGPYPGAWRTTATLWCHDDPGSYLRLGAILSACRLALIGSASGLSGAIAGQWLGNSGDLSDDDFGTIVRYITFSLNGKVPE